MQGELDRESSMIWTLGSLLKKCFSSFLGLSDLQSYHGTWSPRDLAAVFQKMPSMSNALQFTCYRALNGVCVCAAYPGISTSHLESTLARPMAERGELLWRFHQHNKRGLASCVVLGASRSFHSIKSLESFFP